MFITSMLELCSRTYNSRNPCWGEFRAEFVIIVKAMLWPRKARTFRRSQRCGPRVDGGPTKNVSAASIF